MSSEAGIPKLWDTSVPAISGTYTNIICSSLPHHGLGETVSVAGRCTGAYYFVVMPDRSSRGHGSQGKTSRTQGRVFAITPQAEPAYQSVIQGTFLLSHLWTRVLFDSGIAASYVKDLGLEDEILENPLHVSSPLGTRARVDMICRGFELEISRILLTVDLWVMDMSEFDVILGMD